MSDVDWYRRVAETIKAHMDEQVDGRPFYAPPAPLERPRTPESEWMGLAHRDGLPHRLIPPRPHSPIKIREGWIRHFRPDGTYYDEPDDEVLPRGPEQD